MSRKRTIADSSRMLPSGVSRRCGRGTGLVPSRRRPGHGTHGWYFWQTEKDGGDRLKEMRNQYADERGITAMEEDEPEARCRPTAETTKGRRPRFRQAGAQRDPRRGCSVSLVQPA